MASHLNWMLIKNTHCFLMKRNGEQFSRDPLNMKGKNCFKYSGMVHKKAIGIKQEKGGKGVYFITKKAGFDHRPRKALARIKFVRGNRRTLQKIRNFVCLMKYRRELKMLALRRASAILQANKRKQATSTKEVKKN
ncbi:60S ribosomal protein L28 [Echinococcus granulosus]|uniref:Large ribosomal subunit protein eL28 n=1 Tax=Echinococcus granulosus TaxID=6210 RepID=W6UI39_ECHGR|nr:60S ribosomal protein L28 [Echinococcus granulosus]EUB61150.1 60S ribosomal protein L28 [Echinococcus granulosus]